MKCVESVVKTVIEDLTTVVADEKEDGEFAWCMCEIVCRFSAREWW